jgi:hypothetical protein
MSAYREPAVNMYDQQQPIASRGDCDLMQMERVGDGWIGTVRVGPVTTRYVSRNGVFWFEERAGEPVSNHSTVDLLLGARVDYLKALKAVGR